ncbi:hypothetical protein DITRI_Ditri04bG0120700 [Diplodiscus trichospermus]
MGDSEAIVDLFNERDAKEILSIVLPATSSSDCCIWNYSPYGHYTVKDCLPTRTRLNARGMTVPLSCVLCGTDVETDWHMFIDCCYARELLNEVDIGKLSMILWVAGDRGEVARWERLQSGYFKCNRDAVFFQDSSQLGIEMVLRDSNDLFIASKTMVVAGLPPPKEGEIYGLLKAMEWVRSMGYTKVIFEIDAQVV